MKTLKKIKVERIKKIKWQTDLIYDSVWLKKLTNKLMLKGKKTVVEKVIYNAIVSLKTKFKKNPVALFDKTLLLARPIFIFVVKRVFSKNYQVPVPVNFRRQIIKSLGWLIVSIRDRKESTLESKIFHEFSSLVQNKETSLTAKRNKHYDSVTENRINARYRWV